MPCCCSWQPQLPWHPWLLTVALLRLLVLEPAPPTVQEGCRPTEQLAARSRLRMQSLLRWLAWLLLKQLGCRLLSRSL